MAAINQEFALAGSSGDGTDRDEAKGGIMLPAPMDSGTVRAFAERPRPVRLAAEVRDRLQASRDGLEAILDSGTPVYGATTGFGPHVRYAADGDSVAQGSSLIAHLASGAGPFLAPDLVRTTMLVRANALAQGHSGIRPHVLDAWLALLDSGIVPAVPELGSVGASGDLIPLAHMARCLDGSGRALADEPAAHLRGLARPARGALLAAGLQPVELDARDALALVNGTSMSTAIAAVAASRSASLLGRALDLVGWLYASLGARTEALDPRLHEVRHQPGQRVVAAAIGLALRHSAEGEPVEACGRDLQEVYSLRCAPQVLGPSAALIDLAVELVDNELIGVNDNPVLLAEEGAAGWVALHGGNFHAGSVATAADLLNGALTQIAVLAERQINVLATPATSAAPLLLARHPGRQAGLAGAQLTATAVLAEMRHGCSWASTMSIPTNAGNQDIVPMAPLAARTALHQTERLAVILAVLALAVHQHQHLTRQGLAGGRPAVPPAWMPPLVGLDCDRPTDDDIASVAGALLESGAF